MISVKSAYESGILVQFPNYTFICSELVCDLGRMTVFNPFSFSDRNLFNKSFSVPGHDGGYRSFAIEFATISSIDVFSNGRLMLIFDYQESIYECYCSGIEHHHDLFWLIKPVKTHMLFGSGKEIQFKNEYYKHEIERTYNKQGTAYFENKNGSRTYITTLYTATDSRILAIPEQFFFNTLRSVDYEANDYPTNKSVISKDFLILNKENSIQTQRVGKVVKIVLRGISWSKTRDGDSKVYNIPVKHTNTTTLTRTFTALAQAIQHFNEVTEQTKDLKEDVILIGFNKTNHLETEEIHNS